MDNLVSILKTPSLHRDVKSKILRCVQTWAISFKGMYHLSYVEQSYKTLKAEGKLCTLLGTCGGRCQRHF